MSLKIKLKEISTTVASNTVAGLVVIGYSEFISLIPQLTFAKSAIVLVVTLCLFEKVKQHVFSKIA